MLKQDWLSKKTRLHSAYSEDCSPADCYNFLKEIFKNQDGTQKKKKQTQNFRWF